MDFGVLYSSGRDAHVIGVTMVAVGDDCGGGFVGSVCGCLSLAADS
jgi:hypothetical protein